MEQEKLKIRQAVLVEGKYDRLRLLDLLDATVLTTDGFGIFKQAEKAAMLRRIARERGIIVLTDPDGGGKVIRAHLRSVLPKEGVIHLYIPARQGKEARKPHPSKEGFLGVEGIDAGTLRAIFAPFALDAPALPEFPPITKAELYAHGLSGAPDSAERRAALCRALGLPPNLSANALIEAICLLSLQEEYRRIVGR